MGRKIEFAFYFIVILFFIVRYGESDMDERSIRAPKTQPPAVLLPDNALLPRDEGMVQVELDRSVHSGVGTAFAVDSSGTYVTARHVVDGCSDVFFVHSRGGLEQVASYVSERNRDFAVIKAIDAGDFHLALSDNPLARGTDGYMMGFPQGNPADVRATVIGRTEMRSSGRYRMREPVIAWVERNRRPDFGGSLGGISGGPVFRADGTVVGTVVAGAPRRGRVYTTHPRIFGETGLLQESRRGRTPKLNGGITEGNYHTIGKTLRASGAIKQVYCKAN